jgi:hypothetical protein
VSLLLLSVRPRYTLLYQRLNGLLFRLQGLLVAFLDGCLPRGLSVVCGSAEWQPRIVVVRKILLVRRAGVTRVSIEL